MLQILHTCTGRFSFKRVYYELMRYASPARVTIITIEEIGAADRSKLLIDSHSYSMCC